MVELVSITQTPSPLLPDSIRVAADIRFQGKNPETVWFDFPAEFASHLSNRGEPWAVLLLPPAILAGEDVVIDLPVDPTLIENLKGIQKLWQSWYGIVPVEIRAIEDAAGQAGPGRAMFFTGGVDSFFSLLRSCSKQDESSEAAISTLITVWGFDISLTKPEEFARARELGEQAAAQFRKRLIPVATNLKDIAGFDRRTSWWTRMTHGAGLAGVGHLLSKGLSGAVIASTHDYSHLMPWGSHPLADPLLSSAQFHIEHDAASYTRVEKIVQICKAPEIARVLRVCYRSGGASNCSRCSKCLRTMVTFDLLDSKNLTGSFDWSKYTVERIASVFLKNKNDTDFFLEIRSLALARRRQDVVDAVNRSLKHSIWKRHLYSLGERLQRAPVLWRYAERIQRAIEP